MAKTLSRHKSLLTVEGVEFGSVGPSHIVIDLYASGCAVFGEFKVLCVFYNLYSESRQWPEKFYEQYIDDSIL